MACLHCSPEIKLPVNLAPPVHHGRSRLVDWPSNHELHYTYALYS